MLNNPHMKHRVIPTTAYLLCGLAAAGLLTAAPAGGPRGRNRRIFSEPTLIAVGAGARAGTPARPFTPARTAFRIQDHPDARYTRSASAHQVDHAALSSLSSGAAGCFEVPTDSGELLVVDVLETRRRGSRTATLVGRVRGEDQGDALLVYHDGVVSGYVALYGRPEHYEINTLKDGRVVVRLLDESAFTERCGTHDDDAEPGAGTGMAPAASSSAAVVVTDPAAAGEEADPPVVTMDIVVGYGAEARAAEGGTAAMEARIIASVDRMNTAFANSSITNVELVLLGTIEDPDYDYPGATAGTMGSTDELGDLNTHGDGLLDVVSQLRIDLGADLNTFVIKDTDGSAGIGYLPGKSAVVARTYMTSSRITFAHELGHNIGCRHAWGDTDCTENYHNRAWRLDTGSDKYRTVMAYDWDWTRIPWYSNPNVTYAGVRTGAVNGYDATGDTTTDPRLVQDGYSGDCTNNTGYDGTHANLGANNALYILDNAHWVEDNATRAELGIVSPASGEVLQHGAGYTIEWVGGVYDGSVDLDLYKGGVSNRSVAVGLDNNDWSFAWTVPADVPGADDYTIRITVDGTDTADSDTFSIFSTILSCSETAFSQVIVEGSNAVSETFEVWNSGNSLSNMSYTVATNASWVSVSPVSGTSTGEHDVIQVDYDASGLSTGLYSAVITLTAPGSAGSPKTIDVNLTVIPPPPASQPLPYYQDFGGSLPGEAEGWAYYSDPNGRIRIFSGELLLDAVVSSEYALNEAILHLDLAGASNVVLTFDHADYGDEETSIPASFTGHVNGDGVSFSEDGQTWYRLISLVNSFTAQSYDLDAAVQSAGIEYVTSFRIKFQQYDNWFYSSDGRAFDNIKVEREPVLVCGTEGLAVATMAGHAPDPAGFDVWNGGDQAMSYVIATNADWLSATPASGSSTGEVDAIQVVFSPEALSTGVYNAVITISSPEAVAGSPCTVDVALTVFDLPSIAAVGHTGSNLLLEVDSETNWQYVLQFSTDLVHDAWHNVSTSIGDGAVLGIADTNLSDRAFYRLGIYPPAD